MQIKTLAVIAALDTKGTEVDFVEAISDRDSTKKFTGMVAFLTTPVMTMSRLTKSA